MVKKGDTLIEVTLAIGIFSMVAIAVVAVMTSGTSNAQNALETTLAREEIDTQAEALRFIHSAYLADEDTGQDKEPYTRLWKTIVSDENVYKPTNSDGDKAYLQYNPTNCQTDIYDNKDNIMNNAFIINPRAMKELSQAATIENASDRTNKIDAAIDKIYLKYTPSSTDQIFIPSTTYPRLIYNQETKDKLINDNQGNELMKAEGIYVLAVADAETTLIGGKRVSAFYDFYIRTCWYGTGSEYPSAISTVIRLYNPEAIRTK